MPAKRGTALTDRPSTAHPDVVVLGAGVIGLAVAWRAAARGQSVLVLERDVVGAGATRVAAGMLAPVAEADPGERALLELGLASAARWPAFAEELGDASGLDAGYRTTGTLVVARDRDEAEALERERAVRADLGVAVERLLPSAARRLEPALAPTVRGAFLAPDDHQADPRLLVAALAVAARLAGVEIRERTEVLAVAPGAVTCADVVVRAGRVVVATGAWAGGLAGLPALPVRPVKGQTLRLRGEPLLGRTVRYEGGYLVPRAPAADGSVEVVLGASMEERGFDTAMTAGGIHELLRDASELVPGVLELEVVEMLAGLRPGTPDNTPLIGTHDGVTYACGHHRNGILLCPATADLVLGELDGVPAPAALQPGRFLTSDTKVAA